MYIQRYSLVLLSRIPEAVWEGCWDYIEENFFFNFPSIPAFPLEKYKVRIVMLFLRFNTGDEHPSSKKIWRTGVTKHLSTVQFLLWQIASKWWHCVGMVLLALAFSQTWMHAGNLVPLLRTQQLGGHILLHFNSSKKDEGTLPIFLPSQIPSSALQAKGLLLILTQLEQKKS